MHIIYIYLYVFNYTDLLFSLDCSNIYNSSCLYGVWNVNGK
jgi:hypothetical protein